MPVAGRIPRLSYLCLSGTDRLQRCNTVGPTRRLLLAQVLEVRLHLRSHFHVQLSLWLSVPISKAELRSLLLLPVRSLQILLDLLGALSI